MTTPAKACLAAWRDADKLAPNRSKASDGIMGDAAHQKRKSDHNEGNAVDITHDPANGLDAGTIARLAQDDPRVAYVIWDRRIWSKAREAEGWRPYSGANPHTKHVHISIRADARDDDSPWPWGRDDEAPPTKREGSGTLRLLGVVGIVAALSALASRLLR